MNHIDAAPQEPSEKQYFVADHTRQAMDYIDFRSQKYGALDDDQKRENIDRLSNQIRQKYDAIGFIKITESIKSIGDGRCSSQSEIDSKELAKEASYLGADGLPDNDAVAEVVKRRGEVDRFYNYSPTDLLESLAEDNIISCPSEFSDLPADVQAIYLIALRTKVARRHIGSSSYDDTEVYGPLPSSVISQEAELYTYIVNNHTDGLTSTEEFRHARQHPVYLLDAGESANGPLLPVDIRNIFSGMSRNKDLESFRQAHDLDEARYIIGAEYILAAAELASDRIAARTVKLES